MMKTTILFAFFFLSIHALKAQNVTITALVTSPVSLTDTQHIKAIVSTEFSSGGCPLLNSSFYLLNDTVYLFADYQVGMLTVICNSTDTFDLGILPCTSHVLHVQARILIGGSATDDAMIPLNINCTSTGISKFDYENDFVVFPNPVSGELNLIGNEKGNSTFTVSILNLFGETIFISKNNQSLKKLDVSFLPGGVYFVRFETVQTTCVRKIVKN